MQHFFILRLTCFIEKLKSAFNVCTNFGLYYGLINNWYAVHRMIDVTMFQQFDAFLIL